MSPSIRLLTEIPGPRSRALMARREAAVARGVGHSTPVFVESASGALVTDLEVPYNEPVRFEWDQEKARTNHRKHGVSFEEAKTIFDDPLAVIFDDEQHSVGEQREIIIGHDGRGRLLLVFFTERPRAVRIFSARPATRQEQKDHEEGIDSYSF